MESKSRECSFYADEMNYERMESKLKEIQDEYLDFCPDCVDLANDLLKIIEHFRKKCE